MEKKKYDFSTVRFLVTDVDGVLTDGGVYMNESGEIMKKFSIYDGLGIKLILEKGIKFAVISSSFSNAIVQRLKKLGINDDVYVGVSNKLEVLKSLSETYDIPLECFLYIGDDLVDIPCLENVGFPIAVKNSVKKVKEKAIYITETSGGKGAVREICDMLV